jgi:VWFA-related protein
MRRTLLRVTGALALAASAALANGAVQAPTFSSRVEAVRVDVLVTRDGKPVPGLGPGDFEVLDNGVPQNVDLATFGSIPLNVVLALDVSESVAGVRLDHLKAAGHAVLAGLKPGDRSALVAFSQQVTLGCRLTADVRQMGAALDATAAAGETALIDASFAAMTVGESDTARSLVIVFSDGLDTSSWLTPEAVLVAARRSDAVVYAVSLGAGRGANFLRDLTEASGGRRLDVGSTKNLDATFVGILDEFRQRYLLSYSPQGVPGGGWHRLEVRVKARGAAVKARPGYVAASN